MLGASEDEDVIGRDGVRAFGELQVHVCRAFVKRGFHKRHLQEMLPMNHFFVVIIGLLSGTHQARRGGP